MFKKILIANRGEIAIRIIRTCHELGIKAVVVYSEADKDSLPVKLSDEAICIGPPSAENSYLNIPRILSAAEITGCDAIHPGYGFLAENPDFAEQCEACNLRFIGPKSSIIRLMADKLLARKKMQEAGLKVVPGSPDAIESIKQARQIAHALGYPIILKSAAGGGGKGMRIVRQERDLETNFRLAQAEAQASFNDARVYMEKYFDNARHIEVQILADSYGNVIHLFERECSIQRRHQKLIEETPSPLLDETSRLKICQDAVLGASAINYENAGTMEFLIVPRTDDPNNFDYYFMEMNTRIQVEHPITEIITCVDIVKQQILIADKQKIDTTLPSLRNPHIYALECRINAEDVSKDFQPAPGKITALQFPQGLGVRVDSHIYAGYNIPAYYDSLICKIITWDTSRLNAIVRMERALKEMVVEGIKTTIPFHLKILSQSDFRQGKLSTSLVEKIRLNSND
ncbi:MAG: acetyl-CoA carboxylase biotin carboxylase subunit [candidate division WOR-3 bacterium]|nr:acetyl-CoA carboxylase biotin carboxylase subunit [candidate division WOR-3 bacterium]